MSFVWGIRVRVGVGVRVRVGVTCLPSVNVSNHKPKSHEGAGAEWVRGVALALAWTGDRTVPTGFESRCANFASELWQFRLTRFGFCQLVSFGGDTKSRRSLLSDNLKIIWQLKTALLRLRLFQRRCGLFQRAFV